MVDEADGTDGALAWADCVVPDWPAPAWVRGLVTTRAGGVGRGAYASLNLGRNAGDDAAAVVENRRRLVQLCGRPLHWLDMEHGTAVADLDRLSAGEIVRADASVARTSRVACVVTIADCLPALFCDRKGTVVAVAHAGWRGLSAGVLESTINAMGVAPSELLVWLGPAIGPEAFEVGEDVRTAFLAHMATASAAFRPHPLRAEKWLADLFHLARLRLTASGVPATAIYGGGHCTHSARARFFSYRRDRVTGRMAAVIWLDETVRAEFSREAAG